MSEHSFLLETATMAGHVALQHFRNLDGFTTKSGTLDLLTVADHEVDEFVTSAIHMAFPGDAILSEESAPTLEGTLPEIPDRLWVVDPIDGTTNFVHNYPHWSISVAFFAKGVAHSGAVYNPVSGEFFSASAGGGAFLNGRPIHVTRTGDVGQALLATGYAYDRRARIDYYLEVTRRILMNAHGMRRLGSAALDLCWVAAGRIDGYIESGLRPWDAAAGRLILEEAGGRFSDFCGFPLGLHVPELIASNGALHPPLVEIFRSISGSKPAAKAVE